jgi:catechol 2,3-dioxygenase-like lactoylglutathione lyase family enzyme
MEGDINDFHHLGVVSRDLDSAVSRYERLGFIFTPLSVPRIPLTPGSTPEPLGVANRCAIFESNYLEILGVVDAARWAGITTAQRGPYDIDRPLQRYEGLHVLHFATNDLEAVRERLEREGFSPTEIRPFQRPVETPAGTRTMRAKSLAFPPGATPEALVQIAQHETPELVLQPRFMRHPNGARWISEAILCVEDPDGAGKKYGGYTGHFVRKSGHLRIVDLGTARLIITAPDCLREVLPGVAAPAIPFLAGFTVVANLSDAAAFFEQRAVDFQTCGGRLFIAPGDACGAAILFENADAWR